MPVIGERLYDLRKDAGLTQDELAEILQINKHSISSYERNRSEPPDEIKIAIAQYFHVTVDYLLGLTDELNPPQSVFPTMRLPRRFPKSALPELMGYAEYLMYKHNKKE